MHTAIAELEQAQIRSDIPDFRPGDTLKVHVKVTEGNRSRIQVFQGVVIRRQGGSARETFTVRKISYGVGRGADVPGAYPGDRQDRSRHPRPGPAREAVLPALAARQGRQDPRAPRGHARPSKSPCCQAGDVLAGLVVSVRPGWRPAGAGRRAAAVPPQLLAQR